MQVQYELLAKDHKNGRLDKQWREIGALPKGLKGRFMI